MKVGEQLVASALECSHCGHKTEDLRLQGDWCRTTRLRGTPNCFGVYIPAPQREPWDQGGPDTRLATMGELRAAMKSIKKEEG